MALTLGLDDPGQQVTCQLNLLIIDKEAEPLVSVLDTRLPTNFIWSPQVDSPQNENLGHCSECGPQSNIGNQKKSSDAGIVLIKLYLFCDFHAIAGGGFRGILN